MYAETDRFTYSQGLAVAAGIPVGPDGQDHTGVPPEIGALKIYHKKWTPGGSTDFYEIKTRNCTREDFDWGDGSDNSKALFYPTKKAIKDLTNHWEDLICPEDPNEWYSSGNFDSTIAENIMIVFSTCNQTMETKAKTGVVCKTKTEINDWMRFKYFITLTNEKKFIQHKFGRDERI